MSMTETIKEMWGKLGVFLTEYDIQKISEVVRQLDWREQLSNPVVWVVGIAIVVLTIWKRKISLLIMAGSFVLFMLLLQNTLPPPGQSIPLNKVLEFLGGSVLLLAVNVYFLILREK